MSFADSAAVTELGPRQRSAVTNGRRLFVDGDGRTPWSRRFRDLVTLHSDDLGGAELLTEAQASLVRRVATIEVQLEQMEGTMSEGGDVSLDLYTRAASHLRRILETLGIDRKAKDVTPTLSRYLEQKAARPANAPRTPSRTTEGDGIAATASKAASGLASGPDGEGGDLPDEKDEAA